MVTEVKISELPAASSANATMQFETNDSGTSKRVTSSQLSSLILASSALTGTPTAPTAAAGTNTTQVATTAHVFAERTNTATLTNKTLTNPVINGFTGDTSVINIGSGQIYKDTSGKVGIGMTPSSGAMLSINPSVLTDTSLFGISLTPTIPSTATAAYYSNLSYPTTAAASFTLSKLAHYEANTPTFGAGSTVTNQYGFLAQNGLTGATNNYGFYSNIASGTGRWNFYAAGSAANYFGGPVSVVGAITSTNAGSSNFIASDGTYNSQIQQAGNGVFFNVTSNSASDGIFVWRSSNAFTERMRIDSSGNLLFNSGYGSVATAYGCRAWVNFNGTGTVAIRASGNVSSITDNGVGNYRVNFTTALPDTNYTTVSSGYDSYYQWVKAATTSATDVSTGNTSWGVVDDAYISVAVFR